MTLTMSKMKRKKLKEKEDLDQKLHELIGNNILLNILENIRLVSFYTFK